MALFSPDNQPDNAKRFKPGHPGGPGRPKKNRLDQVLQACLDENEGDTAVKIARRLIKLALTGSVRAIQLIAERTQGKPLQAIENFERKEVADIDREIDELLQQAEDRTADSSGKRKTARAAESTVGSPKVQ